MMVLGPKSSDGPMTKELLYICVKNPFCQRDLERMGIEALEQMFDVHILDCTEWLMPKAYATRGAASISRANLHPVKSLNAFRRFIRRRPGGFAIDHVGQFSVQAVLLFHTLKRNGIRIVIVDSGAYPSPDMALGHRTLMTKVMDAVRDGVFLQMAKEKCVRWLLRLLPDQRPDVAFVAGEAWKGDPRFLSARRHIPAHSFDYEVFRTLRASEDRAAVPYAVYLDEKIAGHEDNEELGLPEPANAADFYPALRHFFDAFESSTGMKVVVAAYPSVDIETCRELFGERRILRGRTAELVRDASLVFAHASTAISYAVLWRKPLSFLTSNSIQSSWYQPWIDAPRVLLGAQIISIDARFPDCSAADWLKIDAVAYTRYEQRFLKSKHAPDVSLWQQFKILLREHCGAPAVSSP